MDRTADFPESTRTAVVQRLDELLAPAIDLRIIHCGDTLWHGAWWHIGRFLGPFDAFLPINGARFAWRKPVSEVAAVPTPEQAVAAAVVLNARLIVPIHYGVVAADSYDEVPDPAAALAEAARKRQVAVEVVRPGEWLTWGPGG